MSLANEIDLLGDQVQQLRSQRAKVEYAREAALKDRSDALSELQERFSVSSVEEAEALASRMEQEVLADVREVRAALERLG